MSIASDNFYRYMIELSGTLIGAVESTGPLAVNEKVRVKGVTYTITEIDNYIPKETTQTISVTPTTHKRKMLLTNPYVIENHGYVAYSNVVTTRDAGYNRAQITKVAKVTA